jgi:hypothetical protein
MAQDDALPSLATVEKLADERASLLIQLQQIQPAPTAARLAL